MNEDSQTRNYGFAVGLLTGTVVGLGMIFWLAPRAAGEARQRISESAKVVGKRTADQYRQVGDRLGAALEDLSAKGQSVRNDVADTVARGAHEVERFATAAKAGPSTLKL